MNLEPSASNLNDPAFVRHVAERFPGGFAKPDQQDYKFDRLDAVITDAEAADRFRQAQARKIMRMWWAWKAGAN